MGKIISKVTKPISKVLDKIVPNEIKPILPYIAAIAPFTAPFGAMAGGLGSLGITNPMIQRAVLGGGLNLLSQASQEGAAERGINPLSVALAAGTGYLSSPGATEALQGAQTVGTSPAGNLSAANAADLVSKYGGESLIDTASQLGYSTDLSFLDQAKNLGLEGLSKIAAPLEKATSADLFSMDFLKGAATPVGMAATEQAYNYALDAQRQYEKDLADYAARTGQALADSNATRIKAITSSMTNAGFGTSDIEAALRQIGLLSVGGRVGYEEGGDVENKGIVSLTDVDSGVIYRDEKGKPISKEQAMKLFAKQAEEESSEKLSEENNKDDKLNAKFDLAFKISKRKNMSLKDALDLITDQMKLDETYIPMLGSGSDFIKDRIPTNTEGSFKNGGIIGLMNGGTPMEMDYRGGGFIPIGAKERADDVPARLSKNEFVMTADAVRAAGGGSVNEGARRMYQLMNALEGRTV